VDIVYLLETLYVMPQWTAVSPADSLHYATGDVSWRLFTLSQWTLVCVFCRPYTLHNSGHWWLWQTLYLVSHWNTGVSCSVASRTLASPTDLIHCGTVDTDVSCRPFESHHITLICIYATTMYLLLTSKHQGSVSPAVCGNCNTHQQLWQFITVGQASQNGGLRHRILKKTHDGSHCVKWNNILFIEYSELLKISRMYKIHFNFIHDTVLVL
jgi:hypothetical protein